MTTNSNTVPIISMGDQRIQNILKDESGFFNIDNNYDANPNYGEWRAIPYLGIRAIEKYEAFIEEESAQQGVDPDLVRAIMYVENSQGYHDVIHEFFEIDQSIKPMNIRYQEWADLGANEIDLRQPRLNIRSAVKLIARLQSRVENPTPEKIGSLYNNIYTEHVTNSGARIGQVFKDKPWLSDRERLINQFNRLTDEFRHKYQDLKDEMYQDMSSPDDSSSNTNPPTGSAMSGNLLTSITDFFSSAADRIGATLGLGGGRNTASSALNGRFSFQRIGVDPGSLERLLSQGLDKFTDKVADQLLRSANVSGSSLGRSLVQNAGVFSNILRKGRTDQLGNALEDVFSSGNIGTTIGSLANNVLSAGISSILGGGRVKTSISSQQSDRSQNYDLSWRLSRGQQAAMLAQATQSGMKNL